MGHEVIPSACPDCGSADVKPIAYCYPGSEMLDDPAVALGGCVIYEESPPFVGGVCGATWGQRGVR